MSDLPFLSMAILVPFVGALCCGVAAPRMRAVVGMVGAVATAAVVAALTLKLISVGSIGQSLTESLGGWGAPLGIELVADGFSILMVGMTAMVGLFVSIASVGYFQPRADEEGDLRGHGVGFFWSLWLVAWGGLNGVFLSADLFNMYVCMEVMGLASVALVAMAGPAALPAAFRYLLVTLAGSLFYLFGVALIYGGWGALELGAAGAVMEATRGSYVAFVAMTIGLALKTALLPLHFWLPAAHANAPAPVSAVLSALVVKASFFVYVRVWNDVFIPLDKSTVALVLVALGAAALVWGSVQALRQRRLKMLVAYSTVAQVGYLFIAIGGQAWTGAAYFALSHGLAKGALFLAAGAVAASVGDDLFSSMRGRFKELILPLLAFALAGASLAGLPHTSGHEAKAFIKLSAEINGLYGVGYLSTAGSLLAGLYISVVFIHVLRRPEEQGQRPPARPVPMGMSISALALGALAVGFGVFPEVVVVLLA